MAAIHREGLRAAVVASAKLDDTAHCTLAGKGTSMKRYLAIYTGSPAATSRWEMLTEAERTLKQAAGIAAWRRWTTDNQASIVEMGAPLSRTKLVSVAGISAPLNLPPNWPISTWLSSMNMIVSRGR